MMDTQERPLRILSLDGGGVRGLSSIMILKQIMQGVNEQRGPDDQLEPCEVFDMIGGTSTGGILAIMLGRLRMKLDYCEDAYLQLSEKIFRPRRAKANVFSQAKDFLQADGRFDAEVLETAMKDCISTVADRDVLLKDPGSTCKVFVVATRENNSQAAILRSYKNPRWTGLLHDDCRVWEACRATSAAPTFFAPIQIGKYNQSFIDGAAVANNPIQIAYSEARNMWPGRDAFIISIGTGSAPGLPFKGNLRAIVESMKKIVTETERTAETFYRDHSDLVAKELLFRFNVTYGLSDIGLQDYKEVDRMADATQTYLDQGEIGKKLYSCISRLSASIPKGSVGMKPAEVRHAANSTFVSNIDGHQRRRPESSTTMAMSTNASQLYLGQSNSLPRMFHTAPSPGLESVSTRRSAQLSSSSEMTISSVSSSSTSLDRTQSARKNPNARFIDAAKNGETSLLVVWIRNHDVKSQLDQESINIALIELSKNPEHGSRRAEAVNSLLENCAPGLEYKDTKCGRTPLMWAALFSHEAIIKLLLGKGASLKALDETWRRTPLLWAATIGAYKSVEALLENIRDPQVINAKDKDGNTALALAFISRKLVTAEALLRCGADPNLNLGSCSPLLVSAVNDDDVDFARLLAKNRADVNCSNIEGVPVLSIAVYDKSLGIVRLLIENGADIHASDSEGCTPLVWAIKSKQFDNVKILINRGASRNVADSKGLTAQYWAFETRHKKIISLICEDA